MSGMDVRRMLLLTAHRSPTVLALLSRLRPPSRESFGDNARWEREYQAGGWDWLWSQQEALHNDLIAGLCRPWDGRARILDMGCGEGVLNQALRRVGYAAYLGVDLSATAIERANAMADERTRFVVGNADEFEPDETFDLIVLNECIYYLGDPHATLTRLARHLSGDGAFVISTAMDSLRGGLLVLGIWRRLQDDFRVRHEVTLLHGGNGAVRLVKVLQPGGADRP